MNRLHLWLCDSNGRYGAIIHEELCDLPERWAEWTQMERAVWLQAKKAELVREYVRLDYTIHAFED